MVQIIQGGPSRGAIQAKLLGESLGEGLGNFLGNYQASKALNSVLNDPKLKNAPVSERLQAITGKLRPFGQRGQNMLAQQLGIEQQAMQERQQQAFNKGDFSQLPIETQLEIHKAQVQAEGNKAREEYYRKKLELDLQNAKNNANKTSEFTKQRDKDKAAKFKEIENNYLAAQGRASTYDKLDQLSENLSGPSGFLKPFSAEAAELDALGLSAIEPALKLFNPVGAIPVAKIELIKNKFAPKFLDLKSVQKGKIKALRFINQKALDMGNRLNQLKQKYDGEENIPMDELLNLQNEGTQFINQLDNFSDKDFIQFGANESGEQSQGTVKLYDDNGEEYDIPIERANELKQKHNLKEKP